MPWSGGSYSKGNSATGGWVGDASLGIGIEAGRHDTQDNDFATGINTCLTKDGSNTPSTNLPMGGYKHTNVANGTARNDYGALGQVQDGIVSYLGTTGGTTTAFTVTATPTITTLTTGAHYRFKANAANTGASTLKIDGTAATTMQRQGTALVGGEFKANDIVDVVYDGTNFQIINIAPAPLFIDRTNNRIGIGTTAPIGDLDIQSTNGTIGVYRFPGAVVNGPSLSFSKSRGATVGTNTIVAANDQLGSISFFGANGSGYDQAAYILGIVDGTPGASSDMPGALIFATTADGFGSPGQRMIIKNDGKVGINNSAPGYQLQITTSSAATPLGVNIASAGDSAINDVVLIKTDNVNTAGANYFIGFFINNGATASGRIATNGANAAAFFSTSDITLKENIVDLPSQLDNIMALRPVEFDYKDGSGHQIGFIAQEVETIYPDTVYTDPDGIKFLGDMSKSYARLVKAVQEINSKVDALEARVTALEP